MAQKPKQKIVPLPLLLFFLVVAILIFGVKQRNDTTPTFPTVTPAGYSSIYNEAGLPVYPNAQIVSTTGESLANGVRVTLTTQDSVKDVASYFETEMRKLGWTAPKQTLSVEDLYLGTFTKGDLFYQVTISRVEGAGETQISIVFAQEN